MYYNLNPTFIDDVNHLLFYKNVCFDVLGILLLTDFHLQLTLFYKLYIKYNTYILLIWFFFFFSTVRLNTDISSEFFS